MMASQRLQQLPRIRTTFRHRRKRSLRRNPGPGGKERRFHRSHRRGQIGCRRVGQLPRKRLNWLWRQFQCSKMEALMAIVPGGSTWVTQWGIQPQFMSKPSITNKSPLSPQCVLGKIGALGLPRSSIFTHNSEHAFCITGLLGDPCRRRAMGFIVRAARDYYSVLGVSSNASKPEIKTGWKCPACSELENQVCLRLGPLWNCRQNTVLQRKAQQGQKNNLKFGFGL